MKEQKYDVVVVGSGMGGICAGALAVKEGYRTLVVENLEHIGGKFSTEEVEGFKLLTGAAFIHLSGWVPQVFKEVGAKLELNNASEVFYYIKGKEYQIPLKSRVGAMIDICSRIEVERTKLLGGLAKGVAKERILSAFRKGAIEPEKEKGPTIREWLLRYSDNEDLHNIFDSIAIGWLVAHAYELPVSEFFYFMSVMKGMNDVGMSPRGNLSNMEELAKIVRTNGDVWTGTPAKRILVKKGAVTGVVVQKDGADELEIPCQVVISNVGPKKTVEIAGEGNFNEEYLAEMRVKLRPIPFTVIHVASEKPLYMKGMERGTMLIVGARRFTGAIPLTYICPELAPPGQHYFHFCGFPKSTLVPMDREEEIRQCMLDLKELFPDFEKYGKILKVDSRNIDHDLPMCRTWQGRPYFMSRETPVKNLYNVGDAVASPGLSGTTGCAESAKRVVELLKKRIKPG